jgi:hypothetical protein
MSRQINEFLTRDRHLLELLAIRTALPFMFNCHRDGMQYKAHTDNPIMNYQKAELRCDAIIRGRRGRPITPDYTALVADFTSRRASSSIRSSHAA